ncbi:MAG: GTP cyclohydrolase I [Candidatus Vogelbacteria bacterium]|nr:GTP cyclohydrolase I [Candidatus Vogelbacteria bacterium]
MLRTRVNLGKLEKLTKELLQNLGCDLADENLKESPRRLAATWLELTAGLDRQGLEKMKTVFRKACTKTEDSCDNLIILGGRFHSLCAHHFLPFRGQYLLAYIPDKHNIGASKIQRIVNFHAAKPQVQEALAHQVVDTLTEIVKPRGVAIWCGGVHDCMTLRGVKAHNAWMENRHFQGEFLTNESLRNEFVMLAARGRPSLH